MKSNTIDACIISCCNSLATYKWLWVWCTSETEDQLTATLVPNLTLPSVLQLSLYTHLLITWPTDCPLGKTHWIRRCQRQSVISVAATIDRRMRGLNTVLFRPPWPLHRPAVKNLIKTDLDYCSEVSRNKAWVLQNCGPEPHFEGPVFEADASTRILFFNSLLPLYRRQLQLMSV